MYLENMKISEEEQFKFTYATFKNIQRNENNTIISRYCLDARQERNGNKWVSPEISPACHLKTVCT
jgi:hypothetical protein